MKITIEQNDGCKTVIDTTDQIADGNVDWGDVYLRYENKARALIHQELTAAIEKYGLFPTDPERCGPDFGYQQEAFRGFIAQVVNNNGRA